MNPREAIAQSESHEDLVESVIRLFGYRSYLEIGCQDDFTFSRIDVPKKVGVDPTRGGTLRMTSDTYFMTHVDMFDCIFIDGNHHHDQVIKDAHNALKSLRPGGTLLMHDCAPPNAVHEDQNLCGTAWRAFAVLRQQPSLDAIVADWDYGTGIIRMRNNPAPIVLGKSFEELTWNDFIENRHKWMRPHTPPQVLAWLETFL